MEGEVKEDVLYTDEVEIIEEVRGRGVEVEEVVEKKKGASGNGAPWGATDCRIKEVKANV